MDIKLGVSKNVGLSLALAGIGGFAAGYALCHFVYKSHASNVVAEAKAGDSNGKSHASNVTAEAKEGDSDGKASTMGAMESMPTTPRGSVNGQSSQNGPGSDLKMSLVVRSDLGLVQPPLWMFLCMFPTAQTWLKCKLLINSCWRMQTPGTIGRHCSAAVLGLYKRLHKAKYPELRPWVCACRPWRSACSLCQETLASLGVPAQELSKCKKVCHMVDSEDALLELQAAAKREGDDQHRQGVMAFKVCAPLCMCSIAAQSPSKRTV